MDPGSNAARNLGTAGLDLFDMVTEPAPVRLVEVAAHMRRVAGAPKPSAAERRDVALDALEAKKDVREAVVYVRAQLLTLYRSRKASDPEASVNADDVEGILHRWARCPTSIRESTGHWKGTIFRGGWAKTGRYVESTRPHMNGTALPCWRPLV